MPKAKLLNDIPMPDWPQGVNFNKDETCQRLFKPFIQEHMNKLESYDDARPDNIQYIFYEHAKRVAQNTYNTCLALGLSDDVASTMYWAVLPHDIGKCQLPVKIWDQEEKPSGSVKKIRRTHTLLGAQMVQEAFPDIDHPFKDLMMGLMCYHHEQMDGNGTHGIAGEDLSAPVRLISIVEAYDGYRIWRPHFGNRDITPPGVLKRMRDEKGDSIYDMELFETFANVKMDDYKHGRILQKQTGQV